MEIPYLSQLPEGPLRSTLLVATAAVLAMVLALVLHRIGILLLRRLVRSRPFTINATRVAFRASQACAMLLALRVVLTAAPDDMLGERPISYLCTVLLILALTWLAMRCVTSISATVTQLNPYDVADNLKARRILTQTRVLTRSALVLVGLLGLSFVLLTLPGARQFGASLLASAGVAGLVAGIAARPVLGNFIAGLQIAFSQPIRIDDVLIVNGEWGKVEEIKGTYVVVRVWDERRLIVPLQWFIENPFENWTHSSSMLHGTVFLWLDFSIPLAPLREELKRICETAPQWDGRACTVVVFDANERAMRVRFLVSSQNSDEVFALRYLVREQMLAFITANYPHGLPRVRATHDPISMQDMLTENDKVPFEKA